MLEADAGSLLDCSLSSSSLRQGLSFEPELVDKPRLARQLSPYLCLLSTGVTGRPPCPLVLCMNARDPNSDPHFCAARTLPTEPFPTPHSSETQSHKLLILPSPTASTGTIGIRHHLCLYNIGD